MKDKKSVTFYLWLLGCNNYMITDHKICGVLSEICA